MATYQKRGDKWRAIIRRANYPTMSKTFPTKKLAEEWALSIEAPMLASELELNKELKIIPVSALIRKYIAEVTPSKKSAVGERNRLNAALRNYPHLFNKPIDSFSKKDVIEWRDDRLTKVEPASVFTVAAQDWGLPIKNNPFKESKKPRNGKSRCRRISDDEIQTMLDALDWHEELKLQKHYVAWCFLLF